MKELRTKSKSETIQVIFLLIKAKT